MKYAPLSRIAKDGVEEGYRKSVGLPFRVAKRELWSVIFVFDRVKLRIFRQAFFSWVPCSKWIRPLAMRNRCSMMMESQKPRGHLEDRKASNSCGLSSIEKARSFRILC